jgi:class 3 adenylate cyclase
MPDTAPAAETAGLTIAELAVQTAVPEAEIRELVALGLIPGPSAAGTYERGNMSRVRLIKALEASGIHAQTLVAAAVERRLSFDFAGSIVAEPVGLSSLTVAEACAARRVDADTFRATMLAIGVAAPDPDEPIREDDLELLDIVATITGYGLPKEAVLRTLRSFAIAMRAIVEAQRDLFRRQVEEPALARGVPYHEMFAQSATARIPLQKLGYRTTFLLQRRLLEQLVYDNLVTRFEEALEATTPSAARRTNQAICFVDLSGFTERTERQGDADAARVGSRFIEVAQAGAATHRGNLVKPLGDGGMLHFAEPGDAVRGALSVLRLARERALPPARAGIATGPLIMQDGDYYGRTVNRASRLLGVAAPDQVLVTAEVVTSVRDRRIRFTDIGRVQLKGVPEEVEAFAAATA